MAVLGATSLTGCNSIPGFIPAGSRAVWSQANAPTSWSRVGGDTENNRMLRVVSGSGGGVGGTASPILNNVVPSHTHSFNTGNVSANHTHSGNTGNQSGNHVHSYTRYPNVIQRGSGGNNVVNNPTANANTGGISANHFHGFTTGGISANHTHSGSTDNGSSRTNWAPRYINMILCSKNA